MAQMTLFGPSESGNQQSLKAHSRLFDRESLYMRFPGGGYDFSDNLNQV